MAEIGRTVVRLELKLDRMTDDHERRLRFLERAVWVAAGLGGAGSASGIGALLQVML